MSPYVPDGAALDPDSRSVPLASNVQRPERPWTLARPPFCTPSLIEPDGFCGAHGVAEALCYGCRPYLKAAFRAKGDWCETHKAPESQCTQCHPELLENRKAGEHGVAG